MDLRNIFEKAVKSPLQKAIDKGIKEAKMASDGGSSKKAALPHGTMVQVSKTQNLKNIEMNAYADVAMNLMNDPSYSNHEAMVSRNEFRRTFGDKTKLVTKDDGSQEHISKVCARKKRKKHEEVIDVDVDDKDLKHFIPVNKRAYNNQLNVSYATKMKNNDHNQNEGTLSSASLDREVPVDIGSAICNSTTDRAEELPYLFNKSFQ